MTYTPATRYFQPGKTKVIIAPTYATQANIAAGSDVSIDVAVINGFTTTTADLPTPNIGEAFTSSIPGRKTADQSSIDFYADADGDDIRTVLTVGQDTNVLFLADGTAAGSAMDVFPVRVGSTSLVRDFEAIPVVRVSFSITAEPIEGSTYPSS